MNEFQAPVVPARARVAHRQVVRQERVLLEQEARPRTRSGTVVARAPPQLGQRRPVVGAHGVRLHDHVVVALLGVVGELELQRRVLSAAVTAGQVDGPGEPHVRVVDVEAPAYRSPSTGSKGSPAKPDVVADGRLANCGNSSGGQHVAGRR